MPEFGRRQQLAARDRDSVGAPDPTNWLVWALVAIALIGGSFLSYSFAQHLANADPLLEHESFEKLVQRHASADEFLREYPSLDTGPIPIAFGNKVYKIPRNYLVDLTRLDADPKRTAFEIHVLLPDLTPRTAATADKFVKRPYSGGYGDQMNAIVRGGQEELDLSERRLLWDRRCSENGGGAFRVVELGYRSCEADSDLFLKDTLDGPLIFSCEKISEKNPRCTLAERTGAQYGVLNLEFSRKYLYQSDEIRKRFWALLESFTER
ncbi:MULTISPECIES: hypothetical protein [unclassified Bradyrhizobium]|uniref:hypothetical protein n=1 Tax=unclassified Bradyrhizobium TaxID=2631580 RepID=UPI0028E1D679|nr:MULTISPECIES: hypothetical protein [unclassified Bradyrhizobium]